MIYYSYSHQPRQERRASKNQITFESSGNLRPASEDPHVSLALSLSGFSQALSTTSEVLLSFCQSHKAHYYGKLPFPFVVAGTAAVELLELILFLSRKQQTRLFSTVISHLVFTCGSSYIRLLQSDSTSIYSAPTDSCSGGSIVTGSIGTSSL